MRQDYFLILLVLGLIFVSSIEANSSSDETTDQKALADKVAKLEMEAKITQRKLDIAEENRRWEENKKDYKQSRNSRRVMTGRRSTPPVYN